MFMFSMDRFLLCPTDSASEAGHGRDCSLAACHEIDLRRKTLKWSGKRRGES